MYVGRSGDGDSEDLPAPAVRKCFVHVMFLCFAQTTHATDASKDRLQNTQTSKYALISRSRRERHRRKQK